MWTVWSCHQDFAIGVDSLFPNKLLVIVAGNLLTHG